MLEGLKKTTEHEDVTVHWTNGLGLAFILAVSAATLIGQDWTSPQFSLPEWGKAGVGLLVIGAYLSLTGARAVALWEQFLSQKGPKTRVLRDEPNPFSELFIYLIAALVALAAIAFAISGASVSEQGRAEVFSAWKIGLFVAALAAAFAPVFFSFRAFTNKIYKGEDALDHISTQSVWSGLLIAGLIAVLAGAAGSRKIPEDDPFFGAYILGIVLLLFLVFVLMPHARALWNRGQTSRKVRSEAAQAGFAPADPAHFFSAFDGFLVRIIAPLSGAVQHRGDGFSFVPHLLLISIFLPLTAMGFALPAPFGLLPIGLAILLAFCIGRRWSWVEDDRETAMRIHALRDRNIRLGFLDDLRDEALLGYAFLFILIPLALRQIQLWIAPFAPSAEMSLGDGSLIAWAQFFGTELAKGVPIVDWADIYQLKSPSPFEADNPLAQHLVFGSRLLVDIVIIAALLQAWGIVRRNADQLTLFKDGQLDLLDPFVERAQFGRGVTLKQDGSVELEPELEALFEEHANARLRLRHQRTPYNTKRLGELLETGDPKLVGLVKSLLCKYTFLVGPVPDQIKSLAEQWEKMGGEADELDQHVRTRNQRLVIEGLLAQALEKTKEDFGKEIKLELEEDHTKALTFLLSKIRTDPSFYNAKLLAFKLLSEQRTLHAAKALATGLFDSSELEDTGIKNYFEGEIEGFVGREGRAETRIMIVEAISSLCSTEESELDQNRVLAARTLGFCEKIFVWISKNDRSEKVREIAKEALEHLAA